MGKSNRGGRRAKAADSVPELDKKLIARANSSSFIVDDGDITVKNYKSNIQVVNSLNLTTKEKNDAIKKLHDLTTKELIAESNSVNPMVSGRGRLNVPQVQKNANKVLLARQAVKDYMDSLKNISNKKNKSQAAASLTSAMLNAIQSGSLSFTFNGNTYVRKTKRGKTFIKQ